jgi:hypothetical protein
MTRDVLEDGGAVPLPDIGPALRRLPIARS